MTYDSHKLTAKQRLETIYERNRKSADSDTRKSMDSEASQHYQELERDERDSPKERKIFSTRKR